MPDRGPVYEVTSETEGPTLVPFDVVSGPGGWMSDGSVLGRVKWGPVAHCPQEAAHQQLVPPDVTQMDFLEVLQCHAQVECFKLCLYESQGSM